MLLKLSLTLSLVCLLSDCSHGPRVTVCISNTINFDCSNSKGKRKTVSFSESKGFAAYSPESYQNILNYCVKRNQDGTPIPQFDSCTSDIENNGFACTQQLCTFNDKMNGIECIPANKHFITYSESDQYIAMSQPDNTTVLSFCNIDIKQGIK